MTVEDLVQGTVRLLAEKVRLHFAFSICPNIHPIQVTMMNKQKSGKSFGQLKSEDLDLTMFTRTRRVINNIS